MKLIHQPISTENFIASLSSSGRMMLEGLLEEHLSRDQLQDYRAYPKQYRFHKAGAIYRSRMLTAGNQIGKTHCAGAEVAMHLTGEYPSNFPGYRFRKPILCWAASDTGENTRDNPQRKLLGLPEQLGTGLIPERLLVKGKSAKSRNVTNLFDYQYVRHKSGGMSLLKLRFYTQERTSWQGPPVDVMWFDEEPPEDKLNEGKARTIATQGLMIFSLSPIQGWTYLVTSFFRDPNPETSGRHLTQMNINDAQHLTEREKEEEIASWEEHEREARIYGRPAMGSGQIFKYKAEDISITPFKIPKHWPLLAAIDVSSSSKNPRAHPTAAVLLAWDKDNDVIYVIREYRKKGLKPPEHWMTLKRWGKYVKWAWPKDAAAEKGAGNQIIEMYKNEGMSATPVHAQYPKPPKQSGRKNDVVVNSSAVSVERGVMDMQSRFDEDQLKVFTTCPMLMEELRQYHRNEKHIIVKEMDDLVDALRYGHMMLRFAKVPGDTPQVYRSRPDPMLGF